MARLRRATLGVDEPIGIRSEFRLQAVPAPEEPPEGGTPSQRSDIQVGFKMTADASIQHSTLMENTRHRRTERRGSKESDFYFQALPKT